MEILRFYVNEKKKYGVRIARFMSLFNDSDGNPSSVNYDFSQLQYVRSDNLDSFTEICKQLFEEFQIMEFTNMDFVFGDKVVYTTPLLAQILEIDANLKEKRSKELDELKIRNREWLTTVPKSQVLYKFSTGPWPYVVLVQHIHTNQRTSKEDVSAQIYLCNSDKDPDEKVQLHLYNYISKDGKVLRKRFCENYKNHGYPLDELEIVAGKLSEFNTKLEKLNNLFI